jgi:hypothetical protein
MMIDMSCMKTKKVEVVEANEGMHQTFIKYNKELQSLFVIGDEFEMPGAHYIYIYIFKNIIFITIELYILVSLSRSFGRNLCDGLLCIPSIGIIKRKAII